MSRYRKRLRNKAALRGLERTRKCHPSKEYVANRAGVVHPRFIRLSHVAVLQVQHHAGILFPSHFWSLHMDLRQMHILVAIEPTQIHFRALFPTWELVHRLVTQAAPPS